MFKIIGIDPGNNTGLTIMTVDEVDMSIVSIECRTFVMSKMAGDELYLRCYMLNDIIYKIMMEEQPYIVCMESSFLNMRFPKAVLQLSQYINSITLAIHNWNKYCVIKNYPPKYVKKFIGAGGNADKDMMTKAITNIVELNNNIDVSLMTEHEVDSLAICYLGLEEIRQNPLLGYIND